jgi:glutamate-5-semialdehyde dehydrogenase
MAAQLERRRAAIISANERDLRAAQARGLSKALIDRLRLDNKRIKAMADSLREIAALKDPVGAVISTVKRPNGLIIKKVRVPIGVIFIIYESRPNVTSDCVGLCLKSGNAVILRGGSESINSNIAIYKALAESLKRFGLPGAAVTLVKSADRKVIEGLLAQKNYIDLVMPRGGEALINFISEKSRIPVIKHYKGVCHTYVDKDADLKMAQAVCFNAKVSRPGVCNAMETLLVHKAVAAKFLPQMIERYKRAGVEIRGCRKTRSLARGIKAAAEQDWYAEYLDLILSVKVVGSLSEAVGHIKRYGSQHSDAIITRSRKRGAEFLDRVDSACVYLNASTRFTDGGQFGMGAEMGISTEKLHARGPVGLAELTTYKYKIFGKGQIRQ